MTGHLPPGDLNPFICSVCGGHFACQVNVPVACPNCGADLGWTDNDDDEWDDYLPP